MERTPAADETWLPQPVEEALRAARPEAPGIDRQLGLKSVLASVLGVEREPARIDRFVLERRVGAGGMGIVYRSRDPRTERPVAIKLLDPGVTHEHARFEREARVMRAISHPRVVRYIEHGRTPDGLAYLVMEWLEGRDLAARLRDGPLPVRHALELAMAAAQGLAAVHEAGIVHRDVKPSNLFLVGGKCDDVRVMDFGIARAPSLGTRITATGVMLGTPHYMAPEQLSGESDLRTDVYGLGATLFECLAGRPPFVAEHPSVLLLAISTDAVPRVSAFRQGISGALDALVARMLAKDPRDRPKDMKAVAAEIAQVLSDLAAATILSPAGMATAVTGAAPATSREPPRRGWVGRARELAHLLGALDEAAEEELPALLVVTGAAGSGKSSMLQAVAEAGPARVPAWTCLFAAGSREAWSVPFSVLRMLVESDPDPGESAAERERFADRLGAVGAGYTMVEGERLPIDPLREGDRLMIEWLELLDAWSARGPLLMIVDDAHLADSASLRLLERALDHLAERALAVAWAGDVDFAAGLPAEQRTLVELKPLRARSAGRLAARWGAGTPADELEQALAAAAGNPGHLRALTRELRDGFSPGAQSLVELVAARFERLTPEDRRTLKAASIVGHDVWPGALARMLGLDPGDPALAQRLAALVAEGYLSPALSRRSSEEAPLGFASDLVQRVAYEACSSEELERGHLAMSRWLPGSPAYCSAAMARHLRGAGDRASAARHELLAARAALAAGDARLFDELVARAEPEAEGGEIALLRAQGHLRFGDAEQAQREARAAQQAAAPGADAWFGAGELAIRAAARLGAADAIEALGAELVATDPGEGAAPRRLVAIARAVVALDELGAPSRLGEALGHVLPEMYGPLVQGWLYRARAVAAKSSFDGALRALAAAERAFSEAGELRAALEVGIELGEHCIWSGAWERAQGLVGEAVRMAERLGAEELALAGRAAEVKLLCETSRFDAVKPALERLLDDAGGYPRLGAGALVYASMAALRERRFAEAEALARQARALDAAPAIAAAAAAQLCRCLLHQDRAGEARPLGEALAAAAAPPRRIVELDELVRLAWAELQVATGSEAFARQAIADAIMAIDDRAGTLADPLRRNDYLSRRDLVGQTLRLARESLG